jgi:hypothetical protein
MKKQREKGRQGMLFFLGQDMLAGGLLLQFY